jgi:CBS domain-containing membrane protein
MNTAAARITAETTVREVMTTAVMTLKLNDTLRLADDMMNLAHIRHFPVMDGERLAGVIGQADLLHASMASLVRQRGESSRDALGTVLVKNVMKPAITATPDTLIHEAAQIMVERGVECLLVLEGEKLVGLVSRTDLLRELAEKGTA